jgi:putative iron-dependent peroxidase
MATPQSGVLPESNSHALFLTLRIDFAAPDVGQRVCAALTGLPALTDQLAAQDPQAKLSSVAAFGAGAWSALFPGARPAQLRSFRAREEGPRKAPSTPADLLLHIRSERRDLNHHLAHQMRVALADTVVLEEEVAGFRYLDMRDLTGFVDGTENPEGEERAQVALVGDEDAPFAGGTYIDMQRYVHDLTRWEKLNVSSQEVVFGRTKPDDVELPKGVKPPTAHIARVVIEEDGEELEILRHSMPYGDSDEAGLVFIAYGRSPENFDRMLDRMIYADEYGAYDHLMNYTRALTGCSFFAPSKEMLQQLC